MALTPSLDPSLINLNPIHTFKQEPGLNNYMQFIDFNENKTNLNIEPSPIGTVESIISDINIFPIDINNINEDEKHSNNNNNKMNKINIPLPPITNLNAELLEIVESCDLEHDVDDYEQIIEKHFQKYRHNKTSSNDKQSRGESITFNDHAKRNFYISKENIAKMVQLCSERFDTNEANDEKLAFGYFKESVAMQINDKQIRIRRTSKGDIIIINIDLHYKTGEIMYLIAMENDSEHKKRVQWKITDFMNGNDIYNQYIIITRDLPKSSRNMYYFKRGLSIAPINVDIGVIYKTDFCSLPGKKSKRMKLKEISMEAVSINECDLKWYCEQSWNNNIQIPVVVIKGKRQWIEWKKFVCIYDRYNKEQWIGISLRYYESVKEWKIMCMDYDAGRIFYQYRLVGWDNINTKYQIGYDELQKCITTSLNIKQ